MAGKLRAEKTALCLAVVFLLVCAAVYVHHNAWEGPWQVTTTKSADAAQPSGEEEEDSWPVSLLPGEKIDLNTAPALDLARLPQIGAARAGEIVAWREAHGGFQSPEQLMEVSGIGEGIFNQVKEYITVETTD